MELRDTSRQRLILLICVLLVGVILGSAGSPPHGAAAAQAAPAGYPVSGIDVSSYQGQINWVSVAAGGAQFAYIRASEQANIPDSNFAANYQSARANVLYVGAYHRARPDVSSGTAQADFYLDTAQYQNDGRNLPPMLDIEWPRSNWTGLNACYNLTPTSLSGWIRDFVNEVAKRTGVRTMIYTNTSWWTTCTGNDATFGSNPLFIANHTQSPPPLPAGWTQWTFWQYSDSGTLPGDQDVFNGNAAALTQRAGAVPESLLASVNGRYVTAEAAGSQSLIANRTAIGPWEQFDQINVGGGYVALRSHANGRYVTAEAAGSQPLIANRTAVGAWEKFKLITNSDGSSSLLANANGRYVTAEAAGSQPLIANRTAIGRWEKFHQVVPATAISLMANANHHHVTAAAAGSQPLVANRTAIGPWEQFDQINLAGGLLALRAHANGLYVTAGASGTQPLIANATTIGPAQQFRLVINSDGSISLLANANGRYVTAEAAGSQSLIANRTAIGPWEEFYRTPV
jgi:GH25 family lysozyme M1 (1,4-beta-N-acetylmuramidase)